MSSFTNSMKRMASAAQKTVQKQQLTKTISDKFINLLIFLKQIYTDNNYETIITMSNIIKKNNPKMVATLWQNYIINNYIQQISLKNKDFLMEHDFINDFRNNPQNYFSNNTLSIGEDYIKNFRKVINTCDKKDALQKIDYIIDEVTIITKLVELYNSL